MCAKFGSDSFRNVNLYKVQTNKQTFSFIYKIYVYLYISTQDSSPFFKSQIQTHNFPKCRTIAKFELVRLPAFENQYRVAQNNVYTL